MRFFRPDEYFASVLDIDPLDLRARGFEAVLLDVDNTLMPRTDTAVPAKMAHWVQECKRAGLKALVISNSFQERVMSAVEQLGCEFVGKAMKPLPGGFKRAEELLGVPRKKMIMVGDQTYTDILGAHLAGVPAILVLPLGTEDLPHTRVLRKLDKLFLLGMTPKGTFPEDIYNL